MKKKVKEEREPIKYDRINKSLNIFLLIFIIFYFVNNLIMYFSDSYAYFFIRYILNNINGIFYYLNSHIDYLSYIVLILYYIITIIFIITNIYYDAISKKNIEFRSRVVNRFYRVFIIFSIIIIVPNFLGQFENHLPNFDQLYFQETKDKTYSKEDLIELDKYLHDQVKYLSENIKRDENGNIISNINYNEQAIKDLKNVSNRIPLLKGLYPTRSSKINDFLRGIVGSKTTGFTTPYNTYFDYDDAPSSIISTVTHEFCHTKGLIRENETVYCAFLSGIESSNELSQYAAYLEAFSWVSEALSEIDYETSDSLEDEILSTCLTNNYQELCSIYTKNNNSYINGSKEMYITTYYLKNYQNYQEELSSSLKILTENGAILQIDKEEKTIAEVMSLVEEGSNKHLYIGLKINKEKFNQIKEAIKDNRLYLSVYQANKKDEDSKEKINNPEKYYLSPFKDKDENPVFNLSYGGVEYEYSRVSRLLLEHFDKYGYKKTS